MRRAKCYRPHVMPAPVELRVGGQTYRVVASADEAELRRLADLVDERLRQHAGLGPQAMLLVAMSLAHELADEREKRQKLEQKTKGLLASMLARVDAALTADEARTEA